MTKGSEGLDLLIRVSTSLAVPVTMTDWNQVEYIAGGEKKGRSSPTKVMHT